MLLILAACYYGPCNVWWFQWSPGLQRCVKTLAKEIIKSTGNRREALKSAFIWRTEKKEVPIFGVGGREERMVGQQPGWGHYSTYREWLPWGVYGTMASVVRDARSCPLPSPAFTLCGTLPLPTWLFSWSIEQFRTCTSTRMGAAPPHHQLGTVNVLTCTLHPILGLPPTLTSAVLLFPYTVLLKYLASE